MKSVLEQLYDGEIYPAEQVNVRTEGYQQMRREHYSHYEDFIEQLKTLNPPLDERFIEIMDEQLDALPLETAETFIFGLGQRLYWKCLRTGKRNEKDSRGWEAAAFFSKQTVNYVFQSKTRKPYMIKADLL